VKLVPKNWRKFQHYGHRTPPWIKLHRELLDDYDWAHLPLASKALAPLLWLLASEQQDGTIDTTEAKLAFRLRLTIKEVEQGLKPLIAKGFFIDASNPLAESLQPATSEGEGETEAEREA